MAAYNMIEKIKLKNWRSHYESELEFSSGVNALLGIMGSGKSSVMDAMSFALFGTFPLLSQRKLKLDDILRNKPSQANKAEVSLDFIGPDKELYTVERVIELGKGTTTSNLRRKGTLIEGPNSQRVTEHISRILKVDYEIFSRAIYSEQNQLDYFLNIPKGQRMSRIDNLLRIDRFEKARKKLTSVINRFSEELKSKEELSKELISKEDKESLSKLEKELKEFEEKLSRLGGEVKKQTGERENIEKELEKLETGAERLKALEVEQEGIKGQLKETKENLKAKPRAGKETELVKDLKSKIKYLEEKHGTKSKLEKELENIDPSILKLEKELEACRVRHDYSHQLKQDLEAKDSCPICKAKLKGTRKEHLLKEHKSSIKDLEEKKEKLGAQIKQALERKEKLSIVLKEFSELGSEIEFQEKLAKEESGKIRELKEKKEKLEKELVRLQAEIKKIDYDKKKLEKTKEEHRKILVEEEKSSNKLESTKELMEEKRQRFEELNRKKELLEQYKKDIEWIKLVNDSLDSFQSALRKTQESLRKEFIVVVNEVMDEVWSTLYPYEDLSSVKLLIEEGDYVLKARTSAGWVNVEGRVSGGERSLACLALRIAFSLALAPNLSWLVLDEPTHNLDVQSIDELGVTLKERLPKLIDQIFLITHEERLESAVSGYLYKLERNKEVDEPTKVLLRAGPGVGA